MSLTYEKILAEDLDLGYGTRTVSNPAGGSMSGSLINIDTFLPDGMISAWKYMTNAQISDIKAGTASMDVTTEIQDALDDSLCVFLPAGTYKTSARLKVRDGQVFKGAGSSVSVIKNETTDVIGKDDTALLTGNYFTVSGIGTTKTFDETSTTVAFNFTNTSFIWCEDLAATNFCTGMYLQRSSTTFGSTSYCWYSNFENLKFIECKYGVWINGVSPLQSVNGCKFRNISITNWDYLWLTAGVTPTAGIRYSGYGHTFRDSYIQGCTHHIWRDEVGGSNLLTGVYLESQPGLVGGTYGSGGTVPEDGSGSAIYCPLGYLGNQDTIVMAYGDGVYLAPYDPQGAMVFAGVTDEPYRLGAWNDYGLEMVENGVFTDDVHGWTAQSATLSLYATGQSGKALKILQTGTDPGYAYQVVPTVVGRAYKATFYHKNGDYTGRIYIGISSTGAEYLNTATLNDTNWTQRTVTFVATTTTTYITLACVGSSQYTYFDTVSLKALSLTASGDVYVAGNITASVVPAYANNAAAIAGGLVAGQFYRTGGDPDALSIVH
jgi:hypothetical protein